MARNVFAPVRDRRKHVVNARFNDVQLASLESLKSEVSARSLGQLLFLALGFCAENKKKFAQYCAVSLPTEPVEEVDRA